MNREEPSVEVFNRHRGRMFSVAYGMLGSVMEAEDVVQEAFVRWQELGEAGTRGVKSPRDYLSAVVIRLSIDRMRSARARREQYVGPWLPEPIVTEPPLPEAPPDPAECVSLEETLSMAFLVLLESLTPTERTVFLLREVFDYDYAEISRVVGKTEANCRQIARRARQAVAARRPRFDPSPEERERLTERFIETAASGDMEGLLGILAEDATLYSDGGGRVAAARNPIHGHERVARFILGLLRKLSRRATPTSVVRRALINGSPGLVGYVDGRPVGVLTLDSAGDAIRTVGLVVNPEKLRAVPPLRQVGPSTEPGERWCPGEPMKGGGR
jgi:RNA polymerase sigma-70 factor (ECF subfamily)